MNSYYNPELVAAMHLDLIDRHARYRQAADVRRRQRARRISHKAEELAKRAADLVARSHS